MIKCIIVEDEVLAQDVIRSHIQQITSLELTGVYRNAPEAHEALQTREVDIMFLDIRLPGMSGLQFLRSLPDSPLVVLTTAYAEYALESYEFNVIDYLLKPISFERFSRAVNKILDGRLYPLNSPQPPSDQPDSTGTLSSLTPGAPPPLPPGDHIFVKSNSKYFRVNFSEILYVQAMKDYCKIHTPDYTLMTHQTMNELDRLLPAQQFIRVHKSYIISKAQIRAIYGNTIELGKITIPIGLNYKEDVMGLIGRRP